MMDVVIGATRIIRPGRRSIQRGSVVRFRRIMVQYSSVLLTRVMVAMRAGLDPRAACQSKLA